MLDAYEISRLIEEEGADVNLRDVDGGTALHVSSSCVVIQTLIKNGANVNCRNSRGMTPLHRSRTVGGARVLLENGAWVNAVDNVGNTPLHRTNDMEIVRLLLKYGASVTHRNNKGETPIHMSKYGSKVLALVQAGADVNSRDNSGKTLLMKKARCFYGFRFLKTLLSLGPSVFLKDSDGKTAVDYTIDSSVKVLLLKYGAEQNWRRRKAMILVREKPLYFIARDDLLLRINGLPVGVFRCIMSYL